MDGRKPGEKAHLEVGSEQRHPCDRCGVAVALCLLSAGAGGLLCPYCLAEEEGCGCGDPAERYDA